MTPDTWILLIVFDFSVFSQCYITRRPSLLCSTHTLEYWYLKNWPLWYYSFSFVCFLFCCCYFCFVLVGWLVFLFKSCFVFSGVARAEGRWGWGEMVQEMGGIRMHDVKSKKNQQKFKKEGKLATVCIWGSFLLPLYRDIGIISHVFLDISFPSCKFLWQQRWLVKERGMESWTPCLLRAAAQWEEFAFLPLWESSFL